MMIPGFFFPAIQNSVNFTGSFWPKCMDLYLNSSEDKIAQLLEELCQVGRSPKWSLEKKIKLDFANLLCIHLVS